MSGKPNCINIGIDKPEFVCAECSKNCDCPINTYCVKSFNNTLRGSCQPLDPEGIILNRPCNSFTTATDASRPSAPVSPKKDVDDQLVCGIPLFEDDGTFLYYEWIGYCRQGKCRACAPYGPDQERQLGYLYEYDISTLYCPGRDCVGGEWTVPDFAVDVDERPLYLSVNSPTAINGTILGFVIVITLANLVMCFCSVRNSFHPKKYKRAKQTL